MILTSKYVKRTNGTELLCEEKENWNFNAPHSFLLVIPDEENEDICTPITELHFQEGPIKEVGVNGFSDADLLLAVLTRMEAFQETQYACEENDKVIEYLNKALEAMYSRTAKREARNVEGTSEV